MKFGILGHEKKEKKSGILEGLTCGGGRKKCPKKHLQWVSYSRQPQGAVTHTLQLGTPK